MRKLRPAAKVSVLLCVLTSTACNVGRRQLYEPYAIPHIRDTQAPVKLHMMSGELYALDAWNFELADSVIVGSGALHGIDRQVVSRGTFSVPMDSVIFAETNEPRTVAPFGIPLLAVWSTVWGAFTVACVADPKSCFGSCPTFYLDDVSTDRPRAEGFSSSIAKVLEERDVDALGVSRPGGVRVDVRMTNEALETHAVRYVQLHAVPKPADTEIFATAEGDFYEASRTLGAVRCRSPQGDCLGNLLFRDSLEYRSLTDSADLGIRETVELVFPAAAGNVGLVLEARQTFVSTFLLYQMMAYMGSEAATWLATLERGDPFSRRAAWRMANIVGSIEVSIAVDSGPWRAIGSFSEAGPIASDVQMVPFTLPPASDSVRVRLEMARGSWRIGYVGLVTASPTTATVLDPFEVRRLKGATGEEREILRDANRYLFTHPGDEYLLSFRLPSDTDLYELFLESSGYYYEWMRAEWLAEEDPTMVALMLTHPEAALKALAGEYKRREADFEVNFWNSRFGR